METANEMYLLAIIISSETWMSDVFQMDRFNEGSKSGKAMALPALQSPTALLSLWITLCARSNNVPWHRVRVLSLTLSPQRFAGRLRD